MKNKKLLLFLFSYILGIITDVIIEIIKGV